MKTLAQYINESQDKYVFTDEEMKNIQDFLDKLRDELNKESFGPKDPSEFRIASSLSMPDKYANGSKSFGTGCCLRKHFSFSDKDREEIHEITASAYKTVFDKDIYESLMDPKNKRAGEIIKRSNEYAKPIKFFKNLEKVITSTFNIKELPIDSRFQSGIVGKLDLLNAKHFPTIQLGEVSISLKVVRIDTQELVNFLDVEVYLIIQKPKDATSAELEKEERRKKAEQLAAAKPLDCCGREIQVGDTVAYAMTKNFTGNGLSVSEVYSVSHSRVNVDSGSCDSARCCIVSRKGGKMIE